jgi:two-component system alkaline phosphatase synthesis response regulator PhoP
MLVRMRRVLVVEDDPDIVELLTHYLQTDGWTVTVAGDGRSALERLHKDGFELLILDLQIPRVDGLAVCSAVRADERIKDLPVVMLTARADETDRIVGLEMGADDYVVKPFSPKELLARIRALFRRVGRSTSASSALAFAELRIDRERHTTQWAGHAVQLTAKEFALLVALVEAGGRVLSRQQLLEDVWGYSYADGTRTVDVHVRRLREKLPGLAPFLLTVKSLGYRLAAEETD